MYLLGGEAIYIYSVATETWKREFSKGPHPPDKLTDGGCSLSGKNIYLYGSCDGKESGSLYSLDMDDWAWSELSNGSTGGPVKKDGCRMLTYKDQLVLAGGFYGYPEPHSKQPGSTYKRGYTNELHSYSLTTGKITYQYVSMYCWIRIL